MIPLRDENPVRRTPVVTIAIIIACIAVYFLYQAPSGQEVIDLGDGRLEAPADLAFAIERAAIPCELVTGDPLSRTEFIDTFQRGNDEACVDDPTAPEVFPDKLVFVSVLTSIFLHGGVFHLGLNMLFLWIFGNNIEDRMGPIPYALFYLAGGVAATVAHVASQPDSTIPLVGASGAIAAVMGAYLIWFPQAPIRTMILIVFIRDITARWFLGLWFVLQFFTDSGSGVAWIAHVGGFLFGAAIALIVRAGPGTRSRMSSSDDYWDPTGGIGRGPHPHFGDDRRSDLP
ncbi:MAG: rhomboid family intramembrane serine protease [Acidimicrobiales bacterium]